MVQQTKILFLVTRRFTFIKTEREGVKTADAPVPSNRSLQSLQNAATTGLLTTHEISSRETIALPPLVTLPHPAPGEVVSQVQTTKNTFTGGEAVRLSN